MRLALSTLLLALPLTAAAAPLKVLYLGAHLGPDTGVTDAASADALIVGALEESGAFQVTTLPDLKALLNVDRQRQLLGTEDPSLVAEVARLAGQRYVLNSQIGALGEELVVSVAVIDTSDNLSTTRAARAGPKVQLRVLLGEAAAALVSRMQLTDTGWTAAGVRPAPSFERAHQAWRDGAAYEPHLEKALAEAPQDAAANTLLAFTTSRQDAGLAAARTALAGRQTLAPRLVAALQAAETCWVEMWSSTTCESAWRGVADAHPNDPELLLFSLRRARAQGRQTEPLETLKRVRTLDPTLGRAVVEIARLHVLRMDRKAALAAIDACEREAPRAAECLTWRAVYAEHDGNGAELERVGRRHVAVDPDALQAYYDVAVGLICRHAPASEVEPAAQRAWAHLPEQTREMDRGLDEAVLLMRRGELTKAVNRILQVPAPKDSSDVTLYRSIEAHLLAGLARELGTTAAMRPRLEAMLGEVSTAPGDPEKLEVPVLELELEVAGLRGPLPEALRARRMDVWKRQLARRAQDETVLGRLAQWETLFARHVRDPASAQEALDRLADVGPLPELEALWSWAARAIGATLVAAGRPADAVEYLRRGVKYCNFDPDVPVAQLAYARSLARTGDVTGARAAYDTILAAWGHAQARSTTAQIARKERDALKRR